MGALEYAPASAERGSASVQAALDMARLVEDARRALRGEFHNITQDILDIGSLAGGVRAKTVIGWNTKTGEVVSAQFNLSDEYEHWLLKFDVGEAGLIGSTHERVSAAGRERPCTLYDQAI